MSGKLAVHRDSPLGSDERALLAHEGAVFLDAPRAASQALVRALRTRLGKTFSEDDPARVQFLLSPGAFFGRLTALRRSLLADPEILQGIRDLLSADGWNPRETWFDRLRLRAVGSGNQRLPEAAAAYHVHRDTWYANPPAQLNLWIAVVDVKAEEAPGFWPGAFSTIVENDSRAFDYGTWQAQGGWQAPHADKVYPTVAAPPAEAPVQLACPEAGTLLFSGSHLHGTIGHDSGRTRFSAEIRIVRLGDVPELQPRRNLDNASRGTTLPDFLRVADLAPFPEDAARAHAAWSEQASR